MTCDFLLRHRPCKPLPRIASGLALALLASCTTAKPGPPAAGPGDAGAGTGATAQAPIAPSIGEGPGPTAMPSGPPPLVAPATAPPAEQFNKDDPGHLLARCRDHAARKEWFDAIGDCRRSQELAPASIEPQVELMRVFISLQSFGDAEEAARKVIAARPGDAVAWYYLAWAKRGREEFPAAVEALERATALDPARVEYVQALGMTWCLADNYGRCIAEMEKAERMRPGDERTKEMLESARRTIAERAAPYEKMVQANPADVDNHAALGSIYQRYGMSAKALESYDSALSKLPEPIAALPEEKRRQAAQIFYNRGLLYRDLGRPELAEPSLDRAMRIDSSLATYCWHFIGLSRLDRGDVEGAIAALEKSVKLDDDVAENREALAGALERSGKASAAAEQRRAAARIRASKSPPIGPIGEGGIAEP